jgi:hypothetical protein
MIKRNTLIALFVTALMLSASNAHKAEAQCAPKITSPTTWTASRLPNQPLTVSGNITLSWAPYCSTAWNEIVMYVGCSEQHPCDPAWPAGYYITRYINVGNYGTSTVVNTAGLGGNGIVDLNVGMMENGRMLGTTRVGCNSPTGDCDITINIQNGSSNGTAISCSPIITMPNNGSVLSGYVTVGAQARCNGSYNHLRWSVGRQGFNGEWTRVDIPSGSTTGTLNTHNLPNGNYVAAVAAYPSSWDNTANIPHWSSLLYFATNN